MKVQVTELFKIVTPDEGKLLTDGESYTPIAYMPLDSDPESYWSEINEEEVPQ
jgi:hypothetical protein